MGDERLYDGALLWAIYMGSLLGLGQPLLPAGFLSSHSFTLAPAPRLAVGRQTWLQLASEVLTHPSSCSSHRQQHINFDGAQPLHPPTSITEAHSSSCTRDARKMRGAL